MTLKGFLTLAGLKHFFVALNQKEKFLFSLFIFLGVFSVVVIFANFYFDNTKIISIKGGTFTEGVIGSPRFINPIFAPYSDVDRDLTELVFSGLMKYDKNNKLVPNLAEKYEILEYGKIFEFYLRENLVWSNGKPITAADVIFTIKAIQDPITESPLKGKWLGVEVEKISNLKVRFELKNPSSVFLENTTLGIIPKHIWQEIPKKNFRLSKHNLEAVGSGLYKVKEITQNEYEKIESIKLTVNQNYHGELPYITNIVFAFFETRTDLMRALYNNKITGFFVSAENKEKEQKESIIDRNFSKYQFLMPRYFAIFFNPEKSEILKLDKVRKALNYGTNKKAIISEKQTGQIKIVDSPFLPEIFGLETPQKNKFNLEKANKLLDQTGFLKNNYEIRKKVTDKIPSFQFRKTLRRGDKGDEVRELQRCLASIQGIYKHGVISGYFGEKTKESVIKLQERYRETILDPQNLTRGTGAVKAATIAKLNELCHKITIEKLPLKLTLTTVNQPFLIKTAKQLKEQWREIGVNLEIKIVDISYLKSEVIGPRNYEMLLFGQALGAIPDPFPFWHSTQKRDPGLNLALYENRKADRLLEKLRQTMDSNERKKILNELQDILIQDNPAIFLFNPSFIYFVSEEVNKTSKRIIINPSNRFFNIENWYIKTKRIWK